MLEFRHRVVADPAQPSLVRGRIGILVRRYRRCRHVQEGEVRRIEVALHHLRPVALDKLLGDVAPFRRHQAEFHLRHLGHRVRRAHPGPDDVAVFACGVGLDLHRLMVTHAGRYVRQVDRLAGHVELPAVIDAAQPAFLVAAVEHVRAAMRAADVDEADASLGVAEGDQLFAHDRDANWHAIRFRQFLGQGDRLPEAPEIRAHAGARISAGQEFVVFRRKHSFLPGSIVDQVESDRWSIDPS